MKLMPRGVRRLSADRPMTKKKWVMAAAVVLIVTGAIIWLTVFHSQNKPVDKATYFYDYNVQLTKDSLAKKDYVNANGACLETSSKAYNEKKYDQAISLLQDCISKMPVDKVSWLTYLTLANAAKQKSDNKLELQSLKNALTQAKLADSDADQIYLSYMQNRIKQLGG